MAAEVTAARGAANTPTKIADAPPIKGAKPTLWGLIAPDPEGPMPLRGS